MKVIAIIQARRGSTRLPDKVLLPIGGIPVLEHVIRRVRCAKLVDEVWVATTKLREDRKLVRMARKLGCKTYRGSVDDVLSRFVAIAWKARPRYIVRITGDCPFVDPKLIDRAVRICLRSRHLVWYCSNVAHRRFPDGLDVEVFSYAALLGANRNTTDGREHVTEWMLEPAQQYWNHCRHILQRENLSRLRWTLDTEEDYRWFQRVARVFDVTPPKPTTAQLLSKPVGWRMA